MHLLAWCVRNGTSSLQESTLQVMWHHVVNEDQCRVETNKGNIPLIGMHLDGGNAPDGCLVREAEGIREAVKNAVGRIGESVPDLAQLFIFEIGPSTCVCTSELPRHVVHLQ